MPDRIKRVLLITCVLIAGVGARTSSPAAASPDLIPRGYERHVREDVVIAVPPKHEAYIDLVTHALATARTRVEAIVPPYRPLSPLTIVVAPSQSALHDAQPIPELVPRWAIGTAYPGHDLMTLAPPDDWEHDPAAIHRTLTHEYAHLALWHAVAPYAPPKWFDEGLALYLSGESNLYGLSQLTLASALGELHDFRDISRSFPQDKGRAIIAYYQGMSFIDYFIDTYGVYGVQTLIDHLAGGESFDSACRSVTGLPFLALERQWRESVQFWYNWIPLIITLVNSWALLTVFFIVVYMRKRRITKRRLARMEAEDALLYDWDDDDDDDGYPPAVTIH